MENLSEFLCQYNHFPPIMILTHYICSEDLNSLVKRHIQTVVSLSPSKALTTLENDASELIASGMVTLNAKFMNIEENKLLARVVDMWGFFWDQVLPYVEGVSLCTVDILRPTLTITVGSPPTTNRPPPRLIIPQPKDPPLLLSNTPKLRRQNVDFALLFHEHILDGLVLPSAHRCAHSWTERIQGSDYIAAVS